MSVQARLFTYDIECYPNYFAVTIRDRLADKIIVFRVGKVESTVYNDFYEMVKFFNDLTKWFIGFNSKSYDDRIMCACIEEYETLSLMPPLEQAKWLNELSTKLIKKASFEVNTLYRKSYLYFNSLDMMRMGMKGNVFKALKLMAVNLKWSLIQDLPYNPNNPLDTVEQVQLLDKYNLNDVDITDELYNKFRGDVKLRQFISNLYDVNVMNDPDSVIADKLLSKMYCDATGMKRWDLKELRTLRDYVRLIDCIDPKIKFQTKPLQNFLSKLKRRVISADSEIDEQIIIGNTIYDVKQGGLHSNHKDRPMIYEPYGNYIIEDVDVSSYYPRIIINRKIYPEHLGDVFVDLVTNVTTERLRRKEAWKLNRDPQDDLAQKSLKITINAIFGKLGFGHGWLYDPKAMYSVTLNGQLYLLMLIERLEMEGFQVFYANTDGITCYVHKDHRDRFNEICRAWEKFTQFELEHSFFKKCIILNVNNYLIIKTNGDTKAKGCLDRDAWKDISNKKAFDKPIIPHALYEYWINGISVEETIKNHTDLHDFCMAEKVTSFDYVDFQYVNYETRKLERKRLQKTNRYFIVDNPRHGGVILKCNHGSAKETKMINGEYLCLANNMAQISKDVKPKYSYYIKECMEIIEKLEPKQLALF